MINVILVENCKIVVNRVKSLLKKDHGFKIVGEAINSVEVLKILSICKLPPVSSGFLTMKGYEFRLSQFTHITAGNATPIYLNFNIRNAC
ncbi:hypothetical protein RG47T_4665 [Mucilaginibacter polytrichastri]|uniref:Uncharacterized protein n=1 Tax=Mucilaginibacter polytrichastri TaxID=1302689 RepID=A0A1Q6A5A6_9SPHI|nr:hypothetical protein [Mucilaginibacter polytrichastri]OKS89183.1 hypothetical protein RG47T_4665 [Mucilaginibacter polytrichastri]SFS97631.1 hypothetical protein SAMN04487890_107220 [Mucilaginibacter polytrichastri]